MPNEKEIKAIMDKAKKIAESKKVDKKPDKKPDKKLDKKVDKPKTPPTTEEPSSEVANAQLLNTIKELQRSVVILQKNQETFNNILQSLISKNSPPKNQELPKGSEEPPKDVSIESLPDENQKEQKLTPEEKLARAQEEQAQQQSQEEQARKEALERSLQQQGIKPVIHPQVLYLIDTILKTTGPIVQQALMRGRGGGESNNGIAPMIENFKTFGELSKVFSNIQANIAKGYSDSLKAMSPSVREEMADRMLKGSPVPETSPSKGGHI